ncbi:MAG: hypothetical protein Q8M29_12820 [Bacteroidota bacterium]|nr:hypothetical protein [Bacteroidota bacterium]
MKAIILTLAIIFCLPLLVASKNPESVPDYNVGKSIPVKTLTQTESIFKLTFYASGSLQNNQKIRLSFNGTQQNVTCSKTGVAELKVKPGKYKFQFFYNEIFFEIYTDSIKIKGGHMTPIAVYFQSSEMPVMAEKPVIYVYAPETTQVKIKLTPKGAFNFTYPEYKNGWGFKATPNGDLITANSIYPYLFWDGPLNINTNDINMKEGYHIGKDQLLNFFETKLTMMGLNAKEKADFITYWYPLMSKHNSYVIRFLFNEDYNKYAAMTIDPKPDTIFRVFMMWEPVNEKAEITKLTEQKIPRVNRKGLTVIEWGGTETSTLNKL